MLGAIQAKGGRIKPTHLMYKANLSHKKMMQYIDELMGKNLIGEDSDKEGKYYTITEEGMKFMAEYRRLEKFVDSFGF